MPCKLPPTRDKLLATAKMSPEFAVAWENMPLPSGADYGDIETLKALNEAGLPNIQKKLAATRPPTITETEVYLSTRDDWQSRTIICHPTTPDPSQPSPLIIIFFGGGHCIGHPEIRTPPPPAPWLSLTTPSSPSPPTASPLHTPSPPPST